MRPAPPIPTGSTQFAAWFRWFQYACKEVEAKQSSGARVRRTTRGTHIEFVPAKKSNPAKRKDPHLCKLPVLSSDYFHFGWWYDSAGQIHYWNCEPIEYTDPQYGGTRKFARFTNRFCENILPSCDARGSFLLSYSDCLNDLGSLLTPILGPYDFGFREQAIVPGQLLLGYGQYIDLPILQNLKRIGPTPEQTQPFWVDFQRANCGYFWRGFANATPNAGATLFTSNGYYIIDSHGNPVFVPPWQGFDCGYNFSTGLYSYPPIPIPTPQPLPY